MRWAFIFLSLCIALISYSAPSKPEGKSEPETLGTDQRPLAITILPNKKDKDEAEERKAERHQKAERDAALVFWTKVLAGVALFQFGAFAVHALMFRKQARAMESTVSEMQAARDLTMEIARAGGRSADAAKESADSARAEFIASHRPKIGIKHVYTSEVWGEKPVEIKLVIVNRGLTPAIIADMNVALEVLPSARRLPPRPEYPNPNFGIGQELRRLESGRNIAIPGVATRTITHEENARIRSGNSRLYCHGFVEYLDLEDRLRKTSFCRAWEVPQGVGASSSPGRFLVEHDPDYEYED